MNNFFGNYGGGGAPPGAGENYDKFGDVLQGTSGIFGDDAAGLQPALRNFDGAQTFAAPDGVHVGMACRWCGGPVELTIDYAEMVPLLYGVPPHLALQGIQVPGFQGAPVQCSEWAYSQQNSAWWPKCRHSCGHPEPFGPMFPVKEVRHHLEQAQYHGYLSPQLFQQLSSLSQQRRAQLTGR